MDVLRYPSDVTLDNTMYFVTVYAEAFWFLSMHSMDAVHGCVSMVCFTYMHFGCVNFCGFTYLSFTDNHWYFHSLFSNKTKIMHYNTCTLFEFIIQNIIGQEPINREYVIAQTKFLKYTTGGIHIFV